MNSRSTISHTERMQACLSGEQPDRTPVALWRHFPIDDQTSEGQAEATAAFQRQFDFDLIKVSPNSSFCLKDWGAVDKWTGNMEGTLDYGPAVINQPGDWSKLHPLDPRQGFLGRQLECLRILAAEFSPHTPILQTIFSPLAQAKNLTGKDQLLIHLRRYPEALHLGLERITESSIRFIEETAKIGIAGIFYAIQHASYGLLSREEFLTFGKAYDQKVLEAAQSLWLNMAHIHGEDIMFDLVADYPVQILNWHDRHTPPDLTQARQMFSGVLCGGLRRWETMVLGASEQIRQEAHEAIVATGGRKFILGTGCVLPIVAPYGNIVAARRSVEDHLI